MGWQIGYDLQWQRDIGYGVPAICDHPGCNARIDRGLSFVCGAEPFGGQGGCGLFFCAEHRSAGNQQCKRCTQSHPPFQPKPDVIEWINHKLNDPSWATWRAENPLDVTRLLSERSAILGNSDAFQTVSMPENTSSPIETPGPGFSPTETVPANKPAPRQRHQCCVCGHTKVVGLELHNDKLYCGICLSKVQHSWWPRGRYNGRRIVGLSIKVTIDVTDWHWIPKVHWNFCVRCVFLLCGRVNFEYVYE